MHSVYDNVSALGAVPGQTVPSVVAPVLSAGSLCINATGSSEIDGSSVDSFGYTTIMALISVGAATGSPSSYSLAFAVQSSADGSTSWSTLTNETQTVTNTSGPLGTGVGVYPIRVSDSMPLAAQAGNSSINRYLRVIVTPTFVGGSSPAVPVCGLLVGSRFVFDPVNP